LKGKGKRSYLDAFAEDGKTDAVYSHGVNVDKHARKMAEHEQRMAELEIKKTRLDLEAQGKQLDAEERLVAARHQREREKEQHDLEMFRLRLQFQSVSSALGGASGHTATAAPFGSEPFPEAYGGLGVGLDGNFGLRCDICYMLCSFTNDLSVAAAQIKPPLVEPTILICLRCMLYRELHVVFFHGA